MTFLLRVISVIFVSLIAVATSASAQSWQCEAKNGNHVTSYNHHTRVYYITENRSWFFGITLKGEHEKETATLKFTDADGSWESYTIKEDLLNIIPNSENKNTVIYFPIGEENLEVFKSANSVTFSYNDKIYRTPLSGSRKAITRAQDAVLYDQAVEDDRQHAIAQAESDAQQAEDASIALAECDQLTAHKWDQYSEAAGVEWSQMDGQAGVLACSAARELNGEQARILFQLGRAYDKVENPTTLKLMQNAAWELSYPAAFYHLGTLHEDGLYTPKNKTKAKRNYEEGAALDHVPSRYALGRVLLDEATTEQEKRSAEQLIFKAATEGYPFAHEQMGILAFKGESQIISQPFAHKYLALASDAKLADATYYLSKAYRDGIGVDQDDEIAYVLLRRAADQGSDQAKEELAE